MDLYIVVWVDADSWSGTSRPVSYHATLESAVNALPDFVKKDLAKMERECYGKQVRNYTYNTIEKHELQGAVLPEPVQVPTMTRKEKVAAKISLTETFRRLRINNAARREMGQAKELSNVSKNLIIHLLNAEKEPLKRRINAHDLRGVYNKWNSDIGPGATVDEAWDLLKVRVDEMGQGHLSAVLNDLYEQIRLDVFTDDIGELRLAYLQWIDAYEQAE